MQVGEVADFRRDHGELILVEVERLQVGEVADFRRDRG